MAEFAQALKSQNIWYQAAQYRDAEIKLAQHNMGILSSGDGPVVKNRAPVSKTANMISDLKKDLAAASSDAVTDLSKVLDRVAKLEAENNCIREQLQKALERLEKLEVRDSAAPKVEVAKAAPVKKEESEEEDDDSDVDLFGSDSEDDAAAEALKQKRVDEYNARKAAKEETKGKTIAKSSIVFDVKPWDDETDLKLLQSKIVSEIKMDGLVWGQGQIKPLAYGICKLVINCVVEDDKVGSDDLTDAIEAYDDMVQSVDIAAFNKI